LLSALKTRLRAMDRTWRDGWLGDLDRPGARRAAWLDMMLFDHGVLRLLWTNRDAVLPGVYRSNQPSPGQIAGWKERGIRTIVNVRGPSDWGSYVLEAQACERAGITLIDHRLYSRDMPTAESIHGLKRIFDTAARPLLIHCKSGADRAGLASALFVLFAGGTIEAAQAQLSLRYLHVKSAKTGMLDHFLASYAAFNAHTPTPFLTWVDQHYDRDALRAEFRSRGLADLLVGGILQRE